MSQEERVSQFALEKPLGDGVKLTPPSTLLRVKRYRIKKTIHVLPIRYL